MVAPWPRFSIAHTHAHTHQRPCNIDAETEAAYSASSCCTALHLRIFAFTPETANGYLQRTTTSTAGVASAVTCRLASPLPRPPLNTVLGQLWRQSNEIILVACGVCGGNTTLQCYTASRTRRLPLPRPCKKKNTGPAFQVNPIQCNPTDTSKLGVSCPRWPRSAPSSG